MKVLLTGASGFVGSHILDQLSARNIPTAVLLRPASDKRFIEHQLSGVELRFGSITEPPSLPKALADITHVIHCAGATRAIRAGDFYLTNEHGTRNLIAAVNAYAGSIRRLVHISSLAVAGPATPERPAREDDPPRPVSEYGKSKLGAEEAVRGCQVEFTILRPPAVYGPRDAGFLSLFEAVRNHVLPRPNPRQALSLVFVADLAQAVVACLDHPAGGGRTYFVAGREVVSARLMAEAIAAQMGHWTIPCPLPSVVMWPVCFCSELLAHLTATPQLLNLQKFAEIRAPGWVCDATRIQTELGIACQTSLKTGIARTLEWYRKERWL